MVSLKHKFVSGKSDGTDVTLVKPSNWNAEHDLVTAGDGIALGRPAGAGPGPVQEVPLSSLFPSGVMMMWPGTTAPAGWMLCQGQSLSRTEYAALFAILGTYYGSADANTFSLPDMRGRAPVGVDPGTGRLTATYFVNPTVPGGYGGQESEQGYADVNISASGRSYGANTSQLQMLVEMDTWQADGWGGAAGGGPLIGSHSHHMAGWFWTQGSMGVYADGTYYGGGGGWTRPQTNLQPSLTMNFIIKV